MQDQNQSKTFAYIRLPRVDDYLMCGWLPHAALQGTNHGNYSVLMEYIECECGRVMPRPGAK